MDIASVDIMAVVSEYGSPAILEVGTTYTHMKTTMSRTIQITGTADDGGVTCNTAAVTDANYPGTEANQKYSHRPVVAEGGNSEGDAEEMNVYFINGAKKSTHDGSTPTFTQCFNAGCSQNNSNWWQTWNDTAALLSSDDHIAWSIPQSGVSTDDIPTPGIFAAVQKYSVFANAESIFKV